jgi:hypothetical protein
MARSTTDIRTELDAFYALRLKAATSGGIAEYNVNDNQGSQSVKRISLIDIGKTICQLEAELLDASNGGPVYVRYDR